MYAILLSHGEEQIKCKDCGGEGTLILHGSVKTCRSCSGLGRVLAFDQAHRLLRRFRLPEDYTVTHGQSVRLMFSGYDVDVIIKSLFAFAVSGIKARIVFPVF
jgi:RecJ-like exonuclease